MDIKEVISKRKSIRGFKPDPVPQGTLMELMTLALRAPSWANTQPWEFAIATGKKLEEIRQGFIQLVDQEPVTDLAFPRVFPEPFASRRPAARAAPPGNRDEKERRKEQRVQGSRLYESPCVIYIYTDRAFYTQQDNKFNVYPIFDCGLIAENIMLLATNFGLGTIAAAQSVWYPEVLRKMLSIPDSKLIVLGIGIGYPNQEHPLYKIYSPRESIDKVVQWHGFA
jgi:nitroreductase